MCLQIIFFFINEVHTISFQAFFVSALLLIVHTWNSSPLRSNLLRQQCTSFTVPTTSWRPNGRPLVWAYQWPSSQPLSSPLLSHNNSAWSWGRAESHREQSLDYRESEELSWCPFWSNSLWQGWSCELVHCPAGNATDPIWRMQASSQGISSWTPLKPQHTYPNSNSNPNNSGLLTSLLLPPLSSSLTGSLPYLNLLCHSKTDAWFMQDGRKPAWSIPYVYVAFFFKFKTEFDCISFF